MGQKYVEGIFQFAHMQLYVNRGIGTVELPFRLNCPAELTHYTLTRASDEPALRLPASVALPRARPRMRAVHPTAR
jgi:hypothetical protein